MNRMMRVAKEVSLENATEYSSMSKTDETTIDDAFNNAASSLIDFGDTLPTLLSPLTAGEVNFGNSMSECFTGLGLILVDAAENIREAVRHSLSAFFTKSKDHLNCKITIPGLSKVLSIFGVTLLFSSSDIFALIIAIPLNVASVLFRMSLSTKL